MARSDEGILDEIADDAGTDEQATASTADGPSTEPTATATDDAAGRLDGLFSLKAFALSVGLVVLGVVVGGAIPLVGSIGSLVGVFLAAFLLGSIVSQSRYLEIGLAGGAVVGVTFALSLLTSVALPIGVDFFEQYGLAFGVVGVVIGVGLALVGHYFGRDLRTGLTREL